VCADQVQGMKLLAGHLWSLGHRRIACAVVPTRRRDLLRQSLLELGGDPDQIQSIRLNWRERPLTIGRQLAAEILSQRNPPTAVFTLNDEVSAGVIAYAGEHSLRIPQDLSVAGYDDDEIAQIVWPHLTTVRQPLDRMAQAAVELLTEPATDGRPRRLICPVELIVRNSTGEVRRT
jgi:LacI family transcriptional regulator